jgi:hypothetical protein
MDGTLVNRAKQVGGEIKHIESDIKGTNIFLGFSNSPQSWRLEHSRKSTSAKFRIASILLTRSR